MQANATAMLAIDTWQPLEDFGSPTLARLA
jgi:hypothetical protein